MGLVTRNSIMKGIGKVNCMNCKLLHLIAHEYLRYTYHNVNDEQAKEDLNIFVLERRFIYLINKYNVVVNDFEIENS